MTPARDDRATINDAIDSLVTGIGVQQVATFLKRTVGLVEQGEQYESLLIRTNGPARIAPNPFDAVSERNARMMRAAGVSKAPTAPPAPRPQPAKPRPVKRPPTPQRGGEARPIGKGLASSSTTATASVDRRTGNTIRKGASLRTFRADGDLVQRVQCACGNVYERPYRPGRIPGTCEACK